MTDFTARINNEDGKYEIIFHSDRKCDFEAMQALARIIIDVRNEQKEQDKNEQS